MHFFRRVQAGIERFPLLFLAVLALTVRLYHLASPVIGVHSWRQADTAAIARNFYKMQLVHPALSSFWRLGYPQVDWGGGGYAETEFPLYSILVSLIYRLLGVHDFYARGLSVVFSVIALYFLYRLVALHFGQSVAFWSALFYAVLPLSVFYGRTVQPESLVMMSSLGGLYFFERWLGQEKPVDLLVSWIFVTVAVLVKVLPLVYIGIPLLFLAFIKYRARLFLRLDLWLYALGVLGTVALWYIHAHHIFLETGLTFGFWSGETDRYSWASLLSAQYWLDIFLRLMVRHFAVLGFFVALIGLTYRREQPEDWLWEVGLGSSLLANALAPTSSHVHEYYQLPLMFFGVVFIGKVCDHVFTPKPPLTCWQRPALATALVLTLVTGSVIYAIDYMRPEDVQRSEVYALAQRVKAQTPPNAKILATTGGDPTLLYLAHRHGWMIDPTAVSSAQPEAFEDSGADFLVGSYEVIQSYADFTDEDQKNAIRELLDQHYSPIVNDERAFIVPL